MKSRVIKSFKCYNAVCKFEHLPEEPIFSYRVTLVTDIRALNFSNDYQSYKTADVMFQKMLKYWMF